MITNRKKKEKRKERTETNESYKNCRLQREMKGYNFLIPIYKFPYLSHSSDMYVIIINEFYLELIKELLISSTDRIKINMYSRMQTRCQLRKP